MRGIDMSNWELRLICLGRTCWGRTCGGRPACGKPAVGEPAAMGGEAAGGETCRGSAANLRGNSLGGAKPGEQIQAGKLRGADLRSWSLVSFIHPFGNSMDCQRTNPFANCRTVINEAGEREFTDLSETEGMTFTEAA